ncbi:hypothetical protein [Bacillus cereus]
MDWNETIQISDTKYVAYGAGPVDEVYFAVKKQKNTFLFDNSNF